MKLTFILLIGAFLQIRAAESFAQKISLSVNNASLPEVIIQIRKQINIDFFYNNLLLKEIKPITVHATNKDLIQVLDECLAGQPLKYSITDRIVTITRKSDSEKESGDKTQGKIDISGRVTDIKGLPLPGVTIKLKGSSIIAISDNNGNYKISVPDQNSILMFIYVGFATREVTVASNKIINIVLNEQSTNLNEVVVISALGISRQAKSIGYAQQSIDPERLTETRDVNIVNGLAGKVAGLQVTTTGQPGSSSRVTLRGDNSITGNNQPLWVVDGVPIANNMGDEREDNLDYGNGAADLNPNDIESIEVLKGPNAAALYGSRAANGAILVTTKKGKADKILGITFNQNVMFNTISEYPAYQNVYGEGNNQLLVTNNNFIVAGTNAVNMGTYSVSWGPPMLGQPYNTFSGEAHGYYPQSGNISGLYKTGATSVSNISVSKGDAISSFRASYTFTSGNDVLQKQNLKTKHNLSLSASREIGKYLNIDTRVLYTNDNTENRTYRNLDSASPMTAYIYMPRSIDLAALTPWEDANGNSNSYGAQLIGNGYENPLWAINKNSNEDTHQRFIGGVTATVKLASYLKFRGQVAGDLRYSDFFQYKEPGARLTPLGYYSSSMQNEENWNYEGLFMFKKDLHHKISLTANLGANLSTRNALDRGASISALLVHNMPSINNSNAVPVTNESALKTKVQSIYGSATVGFNNTLYIDITGRNDWSSTLPAGNNSYFYPSLSGSFVFSELLKNNDLISYGKLRASWAQVGNSAPPYSLTNTYTYGGLFLSYPTLNYSTILKNSSLKPEQTVSKEAGVDLTLFKRKIDVNATLYQSNTTNQIIRAQTPIETGFLARFINAGEIRNKGIEVALKAKVIQTKKFGWNLTANWSANKSKVLSLVPGVDRLQLGGILGATVNAQVGEPYGLLRGNIPYRVHDTILVQSTGRVIVEANQPIGTFRPDWIGSAGSTFKYRGFDLSLLVNIKKGGKVYSASYARANNAGTTIESLEGRDDYIFSSLVLGETDNERKGIGQTVGTFITPYQDNARSKGLRYVNSYYAKTDANGNIIYDENGRMLPGAPNTVWANPQIIAADNVLNNTPNVTFDASSVKLSELVLGYTVPSKFLSNNFIKSARLALVGRNLWQIYKNTPKGIDPEAANSSGNAQGLEAGGSFPYAQYGFDLKLSF